MVEARAAGGSPRRYRENLARLSAAQKPARGTAAYSRLVNRPVGRRVAALGATVGMTPNIATVISASLSGLAILLVFTLPPSWGLALAGPLLAAGYVMDSVDGQLARLQGSGSVAGEWLDHTVDCFKTSLIHLAVLVCWYRFPPVDAHAVLLVPIAFSVIQAVTYFGLIVVPFLRRQAGVPAGKAATSGTGEHPLRKWALLPTDYGVLAWSFILLAWPVAFLVSYTSLAAVNAAALAWALRKWWRELRALDDQTRTRVRR